MATDNEQIIRDFCAAWSRRDIEELLGFFTADAVYHNIPIDAARGTEAIRGVMQLFVPMSESIEFEIVNMVSSGNLVFTERVDRFVVGGKRIELAVAGVFELEGGKITAWRDYFDMQTFTQQMPGA